MFVYCVTHFIIITVTFNVLNEVNKIRHLVSRMQIDNFLLTVAGRKEKEKGTAIKK